MSAHQWNALDYSQNASAQRGWGTALIARLNLAGHERVLDLGCGDGQLTATMSGLVPHGSVLGLDVSPEMVALASQQYPAVSHANLAFQVADASHLDLAPEFDVVFSNAALHWVKDHGPLLAGVRRSLKPGGRLLFQMGGRGNAKGIFLALEGLLTQPAWAGFFKNFHAPYCFPSQDEYVRWLTVAGLRPLRVELIPKDMSHQGPEGLAGWVRTTWLPYLERLPEQRRAEFIRQLVEMYLSAQPLDREGQSHVAMVRLEVEATAPC